MIVWNDFTPGSYRVTCAHCGKAPRDKTCGVTVLDGEHGVAHCFRCGYVETRRAERELTPAERQALARRLDALRSDHDAEQRQRQADAAAAAAVRWAAAVPAADHPYLQTLADKDLTDNSIFALVAEHSGRAPLKSDPCTVEIALADAQAAPLLEVPVGEPLFYMEAYFTDADGRPLLLGRQKIVGSRYVFDI